MTNPIQIIHSTKSVYTRRTHTVKPKPSQLDRLAIFTDSNRASHAYFSSSVSIEESRGLSVFLS